MRHITRPPALLRSVPLESRSQLPKRPGVYYVIQRWKPWKVLYVGMSGNMRQRWTATGKDWQHHKLEPLSRMSGIRIHFRTTRSRKMAARLEAIDIVRYKPPLNDRYERLHFHTFLDTVDFVCDVGLVLLIGSIGGIALVALVHVLL